MNNRTPGPSLTDNAAVRSFFEKQGMKNAMVRKFIAAITLRDVLLVAKEYHDDNYLCAFDLLGDIATTAEAVEASVQGYLELIRQMSIFSVDSYLSVKLSSLGLDISEGLARTNLHRLTQEASNRGRIFIRVEPDGVSSVGKVFQIVAEEHRLYPHIGTVVQAYLRRTEKDLSLLIKENVSIRLVDRVSPEPVADSYYSKTEIEAAFRKHMFFLLDRGAHPAIGTHDPEIIDVAKKFIKQQNIPKERYEFEMLFGVRRDLQKQLLKEGHNVRVYIPFGVAWYPYFSKHLAESGFSLGSLFGK